MSVRPTILLTGAGGQLGRELLPALARQGEVVAFDRAALDLARPDAIVAAMRLVKPAIVVNAGAYTNVDQAEREPELADAVNGVAPGVIAEEAKRSGALVVHYSTDYVFDGEARSPYDEDHPVAPRSAYGRSKLAGERAIAQSGASALVFRTSWVYGLAGRNFLVTMRRLAGERSVLRVVDDQTRHAELDARPRARDRRGPRARPSLARRARRALPPVVARRHDLVRVRARDPRRSPGRDGGGDHDRRLPDARRASALQRAGHGEVRADLRFRAAGVARRARRLPRVAPDCRIVGRREPALVR